MVEVVAEPAMPAVERPAMPAEVATATPESGMTSESVPATAESVATTTHAATAPAVMPATASTSTPAAAAPSASGDGYRRKYEDRQQDQSDREDEGLLPHVFLSNGGMSRVCAPPQASVKPERR
jgi:hypothetical protein